MARGVDLAVAAPLAGPEPGHRRALSRVVAARCLQDGARHRGERHPVRGPRDPPVVAREPCLGCPRNHRRGAELVDPEVVPVHEEDEVREAQAPGRVARLCARAGRQATLALDGEDPDVLAAGELEGQRLTRCGRHAVTRGARVELQEEGLAGHLRVPRQSAAVAQGQQVLPRERPAAVVGEREPLVAGELAACPERLIEDREGGIHVGHRVPGREDESVGEGEPGAADVPAHGARQQQRQKDVDLGPAAAGMPRLAVVEGEVDHLVDEVLDDLPVPELGLGLRVQRVDPGPPACVGHGCHPSAVFVVSASYAVTASVPTNCPIRSSAVRMFASEVA